MMRLLACLLILQAAAAAQLRPANGDFETGTPGSAPPSWCVASNGVSGVAAVITNEGCFEGRQCVVMSGPVTVPSGAFGALSAQLPLADYAGRRFRYRAAVRVEGAYASAQLWLRVDRRSGGYSFFDNMGASPIRPGTWAHYTIDAMAEPDAGGIVLGVLLTTPGKVYFDDATLEITGRLELQSPSPASETGVENLAAFARLAGYVRYFHPSDHAFELDWNTFIVDGIRKVEPASSSEELAMLLQARFEPIAPTVQVFEGHMTPPLPAVLSPQNMEGLQAIRWSHTGLGIATENAMYRSVRQVVALAQNRPPGSFVPPLEPYEADLGMGVKARIPLTLYAGPSGTLPVRPSVASTPSNLYLFSIADRATRLANVAITWNVFQHFYPCFDVTDLNVHTELRKALRSAAED
jgi:hypothetical protein